MSEQRVQVLPSQNGQVHLEAALAPSKSPKELTQLQHR